MPNVSLLNTAQLNSNQPTAGLDLSAFDDLEFDGYSLQSSTIISTLIKDSSTPSREFVTFRAPRNDGGGIIGDYFRERKIVVSGYIKQTSAALLEVEIETLKRRLTLQSGNLDRNIGGNVRRIRATLTNPDNMFGRREHYHVTYCPFDFEFTSIEPFWHDLEYSVQAGESITNLVHNDQIENLGTYKAQSVLILIVESVNTVTAFDFTNNTNGGQISISNALAAGDVLIFDGENKSVTLNGTEIDYDGVFPEINYGANSFTLTTTGTSIQYTFTLKYKKTYL